MFYDQIAREHAAAGFVQLSLPGADAQFSREELKSAFDAVHSPNWKDPIDAEIRGDRMLITVAAVAFYAGSESYVKTVPGDPSRVQIRAPGYYLRVGA